VLYSIVDDCGVGWKKLVSWKEGCMHTFGTVNYFKQDDYSGWFGSLVSAHELWIGRFVMGTSNMFGVNLNVCNVEGLHCAFTLGPHNIGLVMADCPDALN
jgi:hypothetical protein